MRTVLAVPFRSATPDEGWLNEMLAATGAEKAVTSTPVGSSVGDVHHTNAASDCLGPCKVKWLSGILGLLTRAACTGTHDAVYFIHDDVKPDSVIKLFEPMLVHAACVSAQPYVVQEDPLVLDYSSRCILWRRGAMMRFWRQPIPEDFDTEGKTLLELRMAEMDAAHVRYVFSNVEIP